MNRGIINHKARARQLRDFSGLRYGNITPTDIDGLIEYHNKAFVIIELKYGDAEIKDGQRIALEVICDDLQSKKPAIVIIARHYQHDTEKDIDTANAIVEKYRSRRVWYTPQKQMTVKNIIDSFLKGIR